MLTLHLYDLTIIDDEWGENHNDFYVKLEADIGIKGHKSPIEVFSISVTSPYRLSSLLKDQEIKTDRGLFTMNDFNTKAVEDRFKKLLLHCSRPSWEECLLAVGRYAIEVCET
ncbi:Imm8 family immunity protein [Priestia megaterium]|uniref:Imm8 family immunity protein n=1 Tax=Priestia megaterium TaxID=1404 RepID=UPI0030089E4A